MPHLMPRIARSSAVVFLGVAIFALAAVILFASPDVSHAEQTAKKVDLVYLFVTGEGPSAKAWYKDAPSTGTNIQDALDKFAKQGFSAKLVTEELRSTSDAVAFVILLERVR